MPEQQSRRANAVTPAAFEAPFETQLIRLGIIGLNLNQERDVQEPGGLVKSTNVDHDAQGSITGRPGETVFATAVGSHHSVRKLRDPQTPATTRVWGIGTDLYVGASGALTLVDGGYSGEPLALAPHRPPLSGDSWMFVGDRQRMRKVRADGLDLPIGLPVPGGAATAVLGVEYQTMVATFEATDATEAVNWVGAPGHDLDGHPTTTPVALDRVGFNPPNVAGDHVYFQTRPPANPIAGTTYDNWWGIPLTRDLTQLTEVAAPFTLIPASDDDIIHFWLNFSHPHLVEEVRLYFVVSTVFDPLILPGTGTLAAVLTNADAYVKAFRTDDFAQYIRGVQAQTDAAETARVRNLRDQDLRDRAVNDVRDSWTELRAATDPGRRASLLTAAGARQWVEFGAVGVPLRRSDFQRLGLSAGRDWSTVTGVIVYLQMTTDKTDQICEIDVDQLYLTGGFGPDSMDPGQQQYDYRCTNYDPRTGAESNGSAEMATANYLDSLRRHITVSPSGAFGDAAVRQRFYRRGGSIIDDWLFLGVNGSDGGSFEDTFTDDAIAAAGGIPIDHFQPVPTVDENGTTILAQPMPAIWGPVEGMLFACGDPYRPGHVYFCVPDQPDHWSSGGFTEVCPPSEELMNGGVAGHQAFVLSRARLHMLYPNLSGTGTVTAAPTLCKRGLFARQGMAVGPKGVYFVSEDGIFVSAGGAEEWISGDIDPLFRGVTVNSYLPIDKTAVAEIRLTIWENKLYFQYTDTGGARQVMVYHLLHDVWRHYHFAFGPHVLQGEDEDILLIGGNGSTYTFEGTSDAGTAIAGTFHTSTQSGGRREEKLFGDMIVDANPSDTAISVTNYLNEDSVANAVQTIVGGSGRSRYIFDAFGENPQKAHSIATEIAWSTVLAPPTIYQLGYGLTVQPEITQNRVTNWDDLGHADEKWVTGITLDVDTGGIERTIIIERDYNGVRSTVDTLLVTSSNRHKFVFSWPAVSANMVRIRPDDDCRFWLLYRADWMWQGEPPRTDKWDIHFENKWDQYHTGLDLYCDTGGLEKRIEVFVDEVQLTNDLGGGLTYWPVVANGRRVVHLTLPWGRGHVYRFRAIDENPGLLYEHRWHLDPEPTEQANWTQNFSIYSTRADKWLKAVIFECDTFGQNKQVQVEVDGAIVETLTVNATGRKVVQLALTVQQLGRVWRMFPVDGNPGRLYTVQPIFDEEPFQLTRWETQETNHGLPGWFAPIFGHITLKSTAIVTLQVQLQINQRGTTVTEDYEIPPTANQKIRHYQSFRTRHGGKGVLVKYVLTSPAPFYLYREETVITVQPWGAADPILVQPFGSDDLDPTRPMRQSTLAAAAPGGLLGLLGGQSAGE